MINYQSLTISHNTAKSVPVFCSVVYQGFMWFLLFIWLFLLGGFAECKAILISGIDLIQST